MTNAQSFSTWLDREVRGSNLGTANFVFFGQRLEIINTKFQCFGSKIWLIHVRYEDERRYDNRRVGVSNAGPKTTFISKGV